MVLCLTLFFLSPPAVALDARREYRTRATHAATTATVAATAPIFVLLLLLLGAPAKDNWATMCPASSL